MNFYFFLCLFAGVQSGFVTLPRFSRLDRQFQDEDIRKGPDITLTRSDSLTSFTVDLGPSLMTEVLSLIDNPSCLQMSNHSQAAGEEEEEEEGGSSPTETPVQTPEVTSPNSSTGSGSSIRNMNSRGRFCVSTYCTTYLVV